jgi:hypothetical protein
MQNRDFAKEVSPTPALAGWARGPWPTTRTDNPSSCGLSARMRGDNPQPKGLSGCCVVCTGSSRTSSTPPHTRLRLGRHRPRLRVRILPHLVTDDEYPVTWTDPATGRDRAGQGVESWIGVNDTRAAGAISHDSPTQHNQSPRPQPPTHHPRRMTQKRSRTWRVLPQIRQKPSTHPYKTLQGGISRHRRHPSPRFITGFTSADDHPDQRLRMATAPATLTTVHAPDHTPTVDHSDERPATAASPTAVHTRDHSPTVDHSDERPTTAASPTAVHTRDHTPGDHSGSGTPGQPRQPHRSPCS